MKYVFIAISLGLAAMLWLSPTYGHSTDPHAEWFMSLKQPDHPEVSCCGPADRYYIDWYTEVSDGYQTVVDGVKIFIPMFKVIWDKDNPTGKAVLFMVGSPATVLCFVMANGV